MENDSILSSKKKRKVMIFGTFDLFHPGHENFFQQAKKLGDYLIVVVARDTNVKKIKGYQPVQNEKKRAEVIRKTRMANEVVLGRLRDKYGIIKSFQPDIIALGYDQIVDPEKLQEKLLDFGLGNVIIKRMKAYQPDIYKTSKLRKKKIDKLGH